VEGLASASVSSRLLISVSSASHQTYNVLTTNQPQYLHNLISVQPCHTTHVLNLWSLLLVHRPGLLWISQIAPLSMLHLVYETNWSPRASSDTVSFTFTYHTGQFIIFTIFTITTCIFSYSFSLSFWTLDSSGNHFLHRPFPLLSDWFYGLSNHLMFYSAQRLDLFAWHVLN